MAPLKKSADLQIGEWTYEAAGHAFYVRIDPAKRWPTPGSKCHAAVRRRADRRRLLASGDSQRDRPPIVYNDGYGLHGKTRDVRFENIAAIECGDDGMSAHDDCQHRSRWVRLAAATPPGLANTGASRSTNRRLYLDGNLGTDLCSFRNSSEHTIADSVDPLHGSLQPADVERQVRQSRRTCYSTMC